MTIRSSPSSRSHELTYLVEHLPPQLHIILPTRADPPLPLPHLRARRQTLKVRTDQLRCTVEETGTFFRKIGTHYLMRRSSR